ncbi:MAG: hypothetical protein JO157_13055 [Acetobacteraceae bacterium]|nr:hypothetical protein [Acetobacteraceae bacterium]
MHISHPISLPETGAAQRRPERGVTVAVILFTLIALAGSLWLSQNGVAPCGEESLTTTCFMP